jgi:hypothetical protein
MGKRIIYTVARGKPKFGEMAMGLGRSLRLIGDTNVRVIATDITGFDWTRYFDQVIPISGQRSALDKLLALDTTDADRVLSIDVDMLAFKRLDPILEYCTGKAFAVQGHWETEGVFHGMPVRDILSKHGLSRMPRFNGGMAYYERTGEFLELLAAMREAETNYDSHGFVPFGRGQHASEEVCMLLAMIKLNRFDYLIPPELQFQHSAAGLVGKLYLDVLKNECRFISRQRHCEFYEPTLFHAWRYKDFLIYWKQLEKLKKLEEFEDKHPTLYMPRWVKWSRSIQRRILKMRGLD